MCRIWNAYTHICGTCCVVRKRQSPISTIIVSRIHCKQSELHSGELVIHSIVFQPVSSFNCSLLQRSVCWKICQRTCKKIAINRVKILFFLDSSDILRGKPRKSKQKLYFAWSSWLKVLVFLEKPVRIRLAIQTKRIMRSFVTISHIRWVKIIILCRIV